MNIITKCWPASWKPVIWFLLIFLAFSSFKSDKPAYRIFSTKGKSVEYMDLLEAAKKADVVFFGEEHDNPICHWLELELAKDIYEAKKDKLVLGAEMFETDNQLLLKEYLSKLIRKKDFEAEAKLWPNYKTDYAPVVDFAREHGLKFYATNVPRRYAAIVNLHGFQGLDSLLANERGLMASLPIKYNPNLACYKNMTEMMGPEAAAMHISDNIAKAQALKDATMAWFIFKNLQFGETFLHFNGSYHSENHEGIVWYLNEFNKRTANPLNIVTITCVDQVSVSQVSKDNLGKADFIICIPEDMTKTQAPALPSMPMPPMTTMPGMQKEMKADTLSAPKSDTTRNDNSGDDDDD
jgi:uncharacterized iron-regulated protein